MKRWSKHWKASKQPRKQRKYYRNAPMAVKHKLVSAHLSKELREKYKARSFPVKKGDEVLIMRGKYKNRSGKVSRISLKTSKIFIEGLTRKKVAGTEIQFSIHPSNLKITNLNLSDQERLKALNRVLNK
ncbi:MAG: 50S ribosomal protein L24 [Candidatus Aenigmarchaeota archaeon]|nr:50S ribosomal protein L24 [Candidatus Aenigmarchaeota archaeon]